MKISTIWKIRNFENFEPDFEDVEKSLCIVRKPTHTHIHAHEGKGERSPSLNVLTTRIFFMKKHALKMQIEERCIPFPRLPPYPWLLIPPPSSDKSPRLKTQQMLHCCNAGFPNLLLLFHFVLWRCVFLCSLIYVGFFTVFVTVVAVAAAAAVVVVKMLSRGNYRSFVTFLKTLQGLILNRQEVREAEPKIMQFLAVLDKTLESRGFDFASKVEWG